MIVGQALPQARLGDVESGFDAMPLAMATLDRAQNILQANTRLAGLLDVPAASLIGENLSLRLHAAAVEVSNLHGLQSYGLRVDRETRWFRLDLPLSGDSGLAMLCDVTHEHTVLARLTRDFAAREQLMHDAEVGVWRYDPDAELYHFSSELSLGHEAAGQPVPLAALQLIQHRDDRAIDTAVRDRLTGEPGSAEAEMRYRTGDGGWRHLRVLYRSSRQLGSGRYEMYGISQNVTALAQARDEANANAERLSEARTIAESATHSKSSFLASVSHEIRTPMNGIVGVLNLLKREPLSAEGRDLLGEALSCSDMLAQLIDDVLDFSKMEAGKLEVVPTATDPCAVLASVMALLHPQADAKNLYLRADCEPMAWANIDPVRLRQCLFNIIGNAVKFTGRGGVEVRLACVGEDQERKLRCEVEDTGVGVPIHAQATLFDRFQQADSGTTRRFGGTGLGLAISRNLARLMGGDMGFTSRERHGSTFWFEISAPPAAPVDAGPPADLPEAPLAGLRILVVDDNRTNRIVGLKSLQALGASAETVESGEAAIVAVGKGDYDLVLMDVNMPGMDGMEATRRIRALDSKAAMTPIIALTADVMTQQQAAYRAAGMNGFVPKPFSPAQLLAEVVRLAS